MKTLVRNVLVIGALATSASGLMAAPASNSWFEQWYKAKYGRSSPTEDARQRAEQANTAYREETTPRTATSANTWLENFWRAKYGRSSPIEEARLRAERESTAYREEVTPKPAMPANTWRDDFWKAKYGRPFPGNER